MRADPIRVLVADDHPIMRRGLREEISAQPDLVVVAEAATGLECVESYRRERPDVVLIDLRLPDIDGIQVLERIRTFHSSAKAVILTTESGEVRIFRAFQAGAMSYLLKNMLRTELIDTIRLAAKGQKRIPSAVASQLASFAIDDALSPREITVLQCAAAGNSNKRIADELNLSEHTVKTHFKNILSKLGANDRTHAVTIALQRGYFPVSV